MPGAFSEAFLSSIDACFQGKAPQAYNAPHTGQQEPNLIS